MEAKQVVALGHCKPLVDRYGLHLVGGSAIAWHLGHRVSMDLDLFTSGRQGHLQRLHDDLVALKPLAAVVATGDVVLKAEIANCAVDFVDYPYVPLEPPVAGPHGVPIAQKIDLAAMKLSAIATRGIRRDFWDLWQLCQAGLQLGDAFDAYRVKFDTDRGDLYHVAMALTYFDDAESRPAMPAGMTQRLWKDIRGWFEATVPKVLLHAP